jgi:hypothetical protein
MGRATAHICELVTRRRCFQLGNGLVVERDILTCLTCEQREDERRERTNQRRATGNL